MKDELVGHLIRLIAWSAPSLVLGLVLSRLDRREAARGFGGLTAGWAAVNLLIVGASWFGPPPSSVASFREFLMLNQGLNVAYIAVGVTMAILGRPFVRGAGAAVAIQGVALLSLDGYLLTRVG